VGQLQVCEAWKGKGNGKSLKGANGSFSSTRPEKKSDLSYENLVEKGLSKWSGQPTRNEEEEGRFKNPLLR